MTSYELTAFSSLFEVAVGINLVFSVWDSLRNQALARFNVIAKELEKAMGATLGHTYATSRVATQYSEKQTKYLKRLQFLSTIGKFIGLSVTVALILLLAYLGFHPATKTDGASVLFILFCSVGISPTFILLGSFYSYYCRQRLHEFKKQNTQIMLDLQDCITSPK